MEPFIAEIRIIGGNFHGGVYVAAGDVNGASADSDDGWHRSTTWPLGGE